MTDKADNILDQIRARRAEAEKQTQAEEQAQAEKQAQAPSSNLKRYVAALQLPYFAFIEVHAESEEQVRKWFDCPDGGFPQTTPTMRDAMKHLPWEQRYSFGGKSIPKVVEISEVKHLDFPGEVAMQIPSEQAIEEGYVNVDKLVRSASEEKIRESVLPWAIADKGTRKVIALFRTRAEARAAREDSQVVGQTTTFCGGRQFTGSIL